MSSDHTHSMGTSPLRRTLLNLGVVLCVAITWALHTQFTHVALKLNPATFNAPYCLMWFSTCFMILCYPTYILYETIRGTSLTTAHREASIIFGERGWRPLPVLLKVGPFLLFWILANYSYSQSLVFISASVATSISSCNTMIVYFLGVLILRDRFVPPKLLSVFFAVGGVAVISLGKGNSHVALFGIILSVASASGAAVYKVCFKRVMGSATLGQVSIFMSSLGFLNLLFNWIPPLILELTDVELVQLDAVPWLPVIGAAILALLFNFSINFGIALLHPLVVSVGMLIGIPLNAVIDVIFRDVTPTSTFIIGTALISISFALIVVPWEVITCSKKSQENKENP